MIEYTEVPGKLIVARVDNRVIGMLRYCHPSDASLQRNVEILEVWVIEDYRRQKVATTMIKMVLDKFAINCTWVSLWTGKHAEEDKSYSIFEKLGFTEQYYQQDYYEKGIGTRLFTQRIG